MKRATAAVVFAICISANMPSSMRAPPDAVKMMHGSWRLRASSSSSVMRSPTTVPIVPPRKWKSITPSAISNPSIEPKPQTTPSESPLFSRSPASLTG